MASVSLLSMKFQPTSQLIDKFTDFCRADEDFEPECLRGKYWELIKLDIIELVEQYNVSGTE
jgi:hypothetical protein